MKPVPKPSLILPIVLLLTLPGCLITTQSYNHGKLLNPGERLMTLGIGGRRSSPYLKKIEYQYIDTLDREIEKEIKDSTRYNWGTCTFDYRVGILRRYPFGKGLETGFHLEAAFRRDHKGVPQFYGPPMLEIDTRFGLPDLLMKKSIFHHNISAGWIIGYWVDNGWFAGYAAGWEFDRIIPYVSLRVLRTATDALNEPVMDDFFTKHNRSWLVRIAPGISLKIPDGARILPEYISPEVSLAFPNYSTGQQVGINGSIGIRWMLGK